MWPGLIFQPAILVGQVRLVNCAPDIPLAKPAAANDIEGVPNHAAHAVLASFNDIDLKSLYITHTYAHATSKCHREH